MPELDVKAVSGALVASCCGISRRQHSNLVRAGVMPGPTRRRYDLAKSVKAYIAYKLADGPQSMAEEKSALIAARRHEIEQRTRTRNGVLVLASVVGERDKTIAAELAGRLDALASRLTDVIGAPGPKFFTRLREETNAIRHHLADVYLRFADEYRTGYVDPRGRGNGHGRDG